MCQCGMWHKGKSTNLFFEVFEISKWLWWLLLYHVKTPWWCSKIQSSLMVSPRREHDISQGMERTLAELIIFLFHAVHLAHTNKDRNESGIVLRDSIWQNGSYSYHSNQISHKHAENSLVFNFSPDYPGQHVRETEQTKRWPDALLACKKIVQNKALPECKHVDF